MTYGTPNQYRRWFEYEKDSHAKVLASLNAVPEEKRSTEPFRKAVTLLAHVAAARRLWLYRFGVLKEPPAEFFPDGVALDEVARRVDDIEKEWLDYLGRLNQADLSRIVEYQSLDAGRFRNTIEDILAQLFFHSGYHRGQIAALLRSLGAQPAVTDFVYWTREPIP
jgi:uncharacterized damage-inducible protein DinB